VANKLFFGDNLEVLRSDEFKDESVDLIYLDPPFNSKRNYNLLFRGPKGTQSEAQVTAFLDTWHWGPQAELEYNELLKQPNTDVAEIMQALRSFLKENDMMAYLVMMANRLLELHRVLKPTGSLYLHCDPTASHFLKIILDGVFGKLNYKTEINWRRSAAHNDAKQGRKQPGNVRDIIFFYTKSKKEWTWNWQYTPYTAAYLESEYKHKAKDGRRFKETDPTANKDGGDVSYEWRVKRQLKPKARWEADLKDEHLKPVKGYEYKGVFPYTGRYWAYSKQNMVDFALQGKLRHRSTGMPRIIQYADEMPGIPLQNDWQDIQPAKGAEYLGYDTQKPVALLERIILSSSNEGDVVLDPFCGCGTAVHASQKLGRQWLGIDITTLAIATIEDRLNKAFQGSCKYDVIGTPTDLEGARNLALRDKYQFQWWAVKLIKAQPFKKKKKGADTGIDAIKFFHDITGPAQKIIVSVKGGKLKADDVRALNSVRTREGAEIAVLISLNEPTAGMKKDAAAAGIYEAGPEGILKFPRVQILTIEGLLNHSQRAEHPDYVPDVNFKPAKKEKTTRSKPLFD
jgi:DNA modification methylase